MDIRLLVIFALALALLIVLVIAYWQLIDRDDDQ